MRLALVFKMILRGNRVDFGAHNLRLRPRVTSVILITFSAPPPLERWLFSSRYAYAAGMGTFAVCFSVFAGGNCAGRGRIDPRCHTSPEGRDLRARKR